MQIPLNPPFPKGEVAPVDESHIAFRCNASGQVVRVAFSLVTFFLATQKKVISCRATRDKFAGHLDARRQYCCALVKKRLNRNDAIFAGHRDHLDPRLRGNDAIVSNRCALPR